MKETLRLSVPLPCTEDWQKMSPAEKGRHCQQCAKTVVDFTGMSDGEVVEYFRKRAKAEAVGGVVSGSSRVCGRFAPDQLGRELAPAPVQRNGMKGWTLLVAAGLMFGKGPADGRMTKAVVEKRWRGSGGGWSDETRGAVLTELTPVSDSTRMVLDTPIDAVTMGTPALVERPGNVADCTGMLVGNLGVIDSDGIQPPNTTTLPEAVVSEKPNLGVVGVVGEMTLVGDTVVCSEPPLDTIGALLAPGLRPEALVTIAPNPVARGGMMRLVWRGDAGAYRVAFFNLRGQIAGERVIEVGGKGQVDDWALPNGLAAGVYFLRVMRPGEPAQTVEVLVQ